MNSYKFSIITPTILRWTLERTIVSINDQTYKNWEHIIIVDGVIGSIKDEYKIDKRKILNCDINHHDGGSTCRNIAFGEVTGDYVLYLDDDDYYLPYTLDVLNKFISGEDFGIFPISFCDIPYFLNEPPEECKTSICQFYHKPIINGEQIKYPATDYYNTDSLFAETLGKKYGYKVIRCDKPLVRVEYLNLSNPVPK